MTQTFRTDPKYSRFKDRPVIEPTTITGYIVSTLRQFFSNKENIAKAALRKDHYEYVEESLSESNPTINTSIKIESVGAWKPETAGNVPAVFVQRTATQAGQSSIGDKFQSSSYLIGSVDGQRQPTLGFIKQVIPVSGSHTIYCVMPNHAGAENLGEVVWNYLLDFRQIIRKDLNLDKMVVGDFGSAQKIGEFGEKNFVVPLVLRWNYQKVSIIKEESPILKNFNQKIE